MTRDMQRDTLVSRTGPYSQEVKDYDRDRERGAGGGWSLDGLGGGGGGGGGGGAGAGDGWTAIAAIVLFLLGAALLYQLALVVQAYLLGLEALARHAAASLHRPPGWAAIATLIVAIVATWRLTGLFPPIAALHPALRFGIAIIALLPAIPILAGIGYASAWLFSLEGAALAGMDAASAWALLPRRTPIDPVTGFAALGAGLVFLAEPARRLAWVLSKHAAFWRRALQRLLARIGIGDALDIALATALVLALAQIPFFAQGTPYGLWPSIGVLAAVLFRPRIAWIAVLALLIVLAVREGALEPDGLTRLAYLAPWALGFLAATAVAVWLREPDNAFGAALSAHAAALVVIFAAGYGLGEFAAPALKAAYGVENFARYFATRLGTGWLVSLLLSTAAIAWLPRWFAAADQAAYLRILNARA